VIETYDALAEEYAARAAEHGLSTWKAWNRILPFLPEGGRMLDVGCGSGVAMGAMGSLQDRSFVCVGVDSSPEMIRVARRDHGAAATFVCCDWLEWQTGGWDVIQAFAFLHLFPKHEVPRLMGKLRSELKPGGLLFCGTTVESVPGEGYEGKADYPGAPQRFRARWLPWEVLVVWTEGWELVDVATHETRVSARKLWLDLLLRKPL
jgi:SAM-dependent methyltransferase